MLFFCLGCASDPAGIVGEMSLSGEAGRNQASMPCQLRCG